MKIRGEHVVMAGTVCQLFARSGMRRAVIGARSHGRLVKTWAIGMTPQTVGAKGPATGKVCAQDCWGCVLGSRTFHGSASVQEISSLARGMSFDLLGKHSAGVQVAFPLKKLLAIQSNPPNCRGLVLFFLSEMSASRVRRARTGQPTDSISGNENNPNNHPWRRKQT